MANAKKDQAGNAGSAGAGVTETATGVEFDLDAVIAAALASLPGDFDPKDFHKVGGLTPIYSPKEALAAGFPPAIVWIDRTEVLPAVNMGRDKQTGEPIVFYPKMLRGCCVTATLACVGKRGQRQVVERKAGDDILIPLTGNLLNNKTLIAAAQHPTKVFLGAFALKGTIDIGQPSELWDWDVRLHAKTMLREGTRYALASSEKVVELPGEKVPALPASQLGQVSQDKNMFTGQAKAPTSVSS